MLRWSTLSTASGKEGGKNIFFLTQTVFFAFLPAKEMMDERSTDSARGPGD